jgi:hypothetical protein
VFYHMKITKRHIVITKYHRLHRNLLADGVPAEKAYYVTEDCRTYFKPYEIFASEKEAMDQARLQLSGRLIRAIRSMNNSQRLRDKAYQGKRILRMGDDPIDDDIDDVDDEAEGV